METTCTVGPSSTNYQQKNLTMMWQADRRWQQRSFPLAVGVGEGKDEAERSGERKERECEGKDQPSAGRLGVVDAAGMASLARLQGRTRRRWLQLGGTICWLPLESGEKLRREILGASPKILMPGPKICGLCWRCYLRHWRFCWLNYQRACLWDLDSLNFVTVATTCKFGLPEAVWLRSDSSDLASVTVPWICYSTVSIIFCKVLYCSVFGWISTARSKTDVLTYLLQCPLCSCGRGLRSVFVAWAAVICGLQDSFHLLDILTWLT
jgi:hypothetical protein